MWIRSMMLMCAIGCVGATEVADDQTATTTQNTLGSGFDCENNSVISGVTCVGSFLVFPVNVDIKDIDVLNNNDLDILSNNLNGLDIGGILNGNKVIDDVEVKVFDVLNDTLNIDVSKNDIDVCTLVGILQLCK